MQATRSRLLKGSTVQYRIIIAHLQQYSLEQKRPMHVFSSSEQHIYKIHNRG